MEPHTLIAIQYSNMSCTCSQDQLFWILVVGGIGSRYLFGLPVSVFCDCLVFIVTKYTCIFHTFLVSVLKQTHNQSMHNIQTFKQSQSPYRRSVYVWTFTNFWLLLDILFISLSCVPFVGCYWIWPGIVCMCMLAIELGNMVCVCIRVWLSLVSLCSCK